MNDILVNSREIVLDILLTLEREDIFSDRLIGAVLDKYDYLDGRDKAFIKRTAEGTIERQIELDYDLDRISSVPVKRMKPLIRCLLRMSAYQLIYMDAVPDSAVCNEACKLAEKRKFRNLKGFVNGVLRNLAKQKGNLPLPDEREDEALYLSVKYSVPRWLAEMWAEEYGREITETLLQGMLQIRPVSVRFRENLGTARRERLLDEMERQGAAVKRSGYLPCMYTLENVEGVRSLPGFAQGAFVVQDVSSALSVEAAGIGSGDFVMDLCAAPGGKSLFAAEKAARVLARDISADRLERLSESMARLGMSNVDVEKFDAARTDPRYLEQADVVLLDVPCSGLGVIGKKRDIKYRVTPQSLKEIVELQKKIIDGSWQYVKPGGILLYSTCTIHRAENEEMVRWILEHYPFEPTPLEERLPDRLIRQREKIRQIFQKSGKREPVTDPGLRSAWIQLLPGYMETDGFFFARLRRRE